MRRYTFLLLAGGETAVVEAGDVHLALLPQHVELLRAEASHLAERGFSVSREGTFLLTTWLLNASQPLHLVFS